MRRSSYEKGEVTKSNAAALPLGLLAVGGAGMFMSGSIGTGRAPFLLQMAGDLNVDILVLSHMLPGSSVAVGVSSFFTGPLAERLGRRGLLVGALAVMAAMMAGSAAAWAYWQVLLAALVGGLASGIHMGTIYGEVGDRVSDSQRGRAMGWLIGGQSLSLLVGVPLATWIGAYVGWRGVSLVIGGCTALVAGATVVLLQGGRGTASTGLARGSMRAALGPHVLALLGASITERICFGMLATYFATYLQLAHHLTLVQLPVPLMLVAGFNFLGNLLGGRITDRVTNRPLLFAVTALGTGGAAVALFVPAWGVAGAVAVACVFMLVNGASRPPLFALLGGVPPQVRATVLGINISCASVGWMSSALLGGLLVAVEAWATMGWVAAALSLAGAVLAWVGRARPHG
jgi:MFS transporter, DHA1 family, inner membrane transport protein